jgi:D-sedoheptulose 7-phosphate isomerase
MTLKNKIIKDYILKLINCLNIDNEKQITKLHALILSAWKKNKKIFICGNGGSAANANHIANDLLIAATKNSKKKIDVESLCSNSSVMTCLANDIGYDKIFSEQIKRKGSKEDLLIVLSGSGNSKNIINVINEAKKLNIITFGILGFNGGRCKKILKNFINYEVNDMQISEDLQMIVMNICVKSLMKQKIV